MLATHEGSPGRIDPRIDWNTIKFSPDGRRVAYVIRDHRPGHGVVMPWETGGPDPFGMLERKLKGTDQFAVVLDGEQHASYAQIDLLRFSADGGRIAYVAHRGDDVVAVFDNSRR